MTQTLSERLREAAAQSLWEVQVERWSGAAGALYREAADALDTLTAERDEARTVVANINNEVIGSQGYFTEPSCVTAVQELKLSHNRLTATLREREAELDLARLELRARQEGCPSCGWVGWDHDEGCGRFIPAERVSTLTAAHEALKAERDRYRALLQDAVRFLPLDHPSVRGFVEEARSTLASPDDRGTVAAQTPGTKE